MEENSKYVIITIEQIADQLSKVKFRKLARKYIFILRTRFQVKCIAKFSILFSIKKNFNISKLIQYQPPHTKYEDYPTRPSSRSQLGIVYHLVPLLHDPRSITAYPHFGQARDAEEAPSHKAINVSMMRQAHAGSAIGAGSYIQCLPSIQLRPSRLMQLHQLYLSYLSHRSSIRIQDQWKTSPTTGSSMARPSEALCHLDRYAAIQGFMVEEPDGSTCISDWPQETNHCIQEHDSHQQLQQRRTKLQTSQTYRPTWAHHNWHQHNEQQWSPHKDMELYTTSMPFGQAPSSSTCSEPRLIKFCLPTDPLDYASMAGESFVNLLELIGHPQKIPKDLEKSLPINFHNKNSLEQNIHIQWVNRMVRMYISQLMHFRLKYFQGKVRYNFQFQTTTILGGFGMALELSNFQGEIAMRINLRNQSNSVTLSERE